MRVTAERLTDKDAWRRAAAATMGGRLPTRTTWAQMLRCEHSPIRACWYRLTLEVPAFVSVHFVRHKVGVEHYVQSLRDDRGGDGSEGRNTPVLHLMDANAQALIGMARKRLCKQAHAQTREAMILIVEAVRGIDPDLAACLVPECVYRGGCRELRGCKTAPGGEV